MTNALQRAGQTQPVPVMEGPVYNLDGFPADRFIRLIPTQTIAMPGDLVVPVVQIVQLDPDPKNGADVYTSRDIGEGKVALTRVGLRKVATAAAVNIVDSHRTDDGSDPTVCEWSVTAEMALPTGQRIRAIGTKRIVMSALTWASDAQRAKFKSALAEHTAARAENRAIRSLLSLRGSYPAAEIRKAFAVVTYSANMSHPEIRSRMIDAMTGAASALYGPEPAKGIAAGDQVTTVEPVADEDDEQPYIKVVTNGNATVDKATGEIVASDDDEPDWLAGEAAAPDLVSRLKAVADANAAATDPLTPEQKAQLGQLFPGRSAPDGFTGTEVSAVTRHAWGIASSELQQRHAQALLEVAGALGADPFRAEYRATAQRLLEAAS